MSKKFFTKLLPFLSIIGVGAIISSCTDDKYDLNELDMTIGVGSNNGITIPTSSTNTIKLSDILELNDGDCVSEDPQTHDYLFHQESSNISPTKVTVDKITLDSPTTKEFVFTVNLPQINITIPSFPAKGRKALPFQAFQEFTLSEHKDIQTFSFKKELPDDVADLKEVKITPNHVNLKVMFSNLDKIIKKIDKVIIELPSFMEIPTITGATYTRNGNTLTLLDVPTTELNLGLVVTGVEFDKASAKEKHLWIENNEINLEGTVSMAIETTIKPDMLGMQEVLVLKDLIDNHKSIDVNSRLTIENFVITEAEGNFDPEIKLDELGSTSINSVPDFLKEEGTCIDLDNPQIYVTINNSMDVVGNIEGKIFAYKDGKELPNTPVEVKGITIKPHDTDNSAYTTSRICICRNPEAIAEKDPNTQYVKVENLSNIIRTIPDRIEFKEVVATADPSNLTTLKLGHAYEITPAYWVDAPIAFEEDANIIYVKSFDGLSDDLEDIDLTENSCVKVNANIVNTVPAYLSVTADPIDVKGNIISKQELEVEIVSDIAASDGKTPKVSPISINVTQKKSNALKKLDGFKIRIHLTAKDPNKKNNPVTGVTLNGENHNIKVENINVTVVGTAIFDAN